MTSLAPYTTFGIGGDAKSFVDATTTDELIDAVQSADVADEPLLVLSGGSNVLISDDGFPGQVVHVATRGIEVEHTDDYVKLTVAAGESMDALVAQAVDNGWAGLEALSGIPGLVGAAPVQNIGAYGAEIATSIAHVNRWDRTNQSQRRIDAVECGFGYRISQFKALRPGQVTGRFVVLDVTFWLKPSPLSDPIAYPELAKALGVAMGDRVPLTDVRETVLALRRSKAMVYDKADPDTHGAGSFFTNPLLTIEDAEQLAPEAPRYSVSSGYVKVSAAWLIEHAGFPKGFGTNQAKVSSKHALALTNQGGATARDVSALARQIKDGVEARYGITLYPEPILVGVQL